MDDYGAWRAALKALAGEAEEAVAGGGAGAVLQGRPGLADALVLVDLRARDGLAGARRDALLVAQAGDVVRGAEGAAPVVARHLAAAAPHAAVALPAVPRGAQAHAVDVLRILRAALHARVLRHAD